MATLSIDLADFDLSNTSSLLALFTLNELTINLLYGLNALIEVHSSSTSLMSKFYLFYLIDLLDPAFLFLVIFLYS